MVLMIFETTSKNGKLLSMKLLRNKALCCLGSRSRVSAVKPAKERLDRSQSKVKAVECTKEDNRFPKVLDGDEVTPSELS